MQRYCQSVFLIFCQCKPDFCWDLVFSFDRADFIGQNLTISEAFCIGHVSISWTQNQFFLLLFLLPLLSVHFKMNSNHGITCSIDHIQNWQRKVKFCIFNQIHRRQFSLGYANLLLRSTYRFQLHSKFCVSEKTDILVVSTCVNLTGRTAFSTTTNGRQKQIELPINAMTGISISFLFTSNHFRISFWSDLSAWWFFKCQSFTLLSLLVRWLKRFAEAILYQCYFLDKIWEKINRMQI